jgi:hypothetical protein
VQKGYAAGPGGEWKLQVDGYAGRPSCVLVGAGSPVIHLAVAGRSVADGRWHRLGRGNDQFHGAVDDVFVATG